MSYTLVTRITTTNDKEYADIDAWIEDHGHCGTTYPDLLDSSLVLEEGGKSVMRTLVYLNEDARIDHVENHDISTKERDHTADDIEENE
jgi:hypothetical protein